MITMLRWMILSLIGGGLMVSSAMAEVAVVVHPDTEMNQVKRITVKNLFLGKIQKLPNGSQPIIRMLPEESQATEIFCERVLDKSLRQWRRYWARLKFSGQRIKPKTIESAEQLKQFILDNPKGMGYMDVMDVDERVKVVLVVSD